MTDRKTHWSNIPIIYFNYDKEHNKNFQKYVVKKLERNIDSLSIGACIILCPMSEEENNLYENYIFVYKKNTTTIRTNWVQFREISRLDNGKKVNTYSTDLSGNVSITPKSVVKYIQYRGLSGIKVTSMSDDILRIILSVHIKFNEKEKLFSLNIDKSDFHLLK